MTADEAMGMLDDLDRPGEVWLSDWEIEFVDSVMKRCERGQDLTPRQEAMLRKIHGEKAE